MNSRQDFLIDPIKIVRELAGLPHRGTTTAEERKAAEILQGHLERLGATVEQQRFRTSKTYISEVWWLLSILVLGLILIPYTSWIALGLVALSVVTSLLYFDWRTTPVSFLPPRGKSANVIGRMNQTADPDKTSHTGPSKNKLILMAHYDSAPVSLLYLPSIEADSLFNRIGPGVWHTGDFDSIWFTRIGIPSLTLSAQDNDGQIPNLHSPGDTVENVDASLLPIAVEFAEATIRRLAQSM